MPALRNRPSPIPALTLLLSAALFHADPLFAASPGIAFYVTSGREASPADGDSLHRAVFVIHCPSSAPGPIFLRVFDADAGGAFDQTVTPGRFRFRLYGRGGPAPGVRAIEDDPGPAAPLLDLELGDDPLYDNQWRTLASVRAADGDPADSSAVFQLLVDGTEGASVNLYRLFVSSEEKRNSAVEGLAIRTPVATVYTPRSESAATLFFFRIPDGAELLDIANFDAEGMGRVHLETVRRDRVALGLSGNGASAVTRIRVAEDERGTRAALVLSGSRTAPDYVQCWIRDEGGRDVPLEHPALTAPMNRLPVPRFEAVPLSDCRSMVFDASGSADPDGDAMEFEWTVDGAAAGRGRRIVHALPGPGAYRIGLSARDQSGFVACTGRLSRTVTMNRPPEAVWDAPPAVAPLEPVVFDAGRSHDPDGRIVRAHWDFGDGAAADGMRVRRAYATAGRYRTTLRVEDDSGSPCDASERSAVVWVNAPPVAALSLKTRAAVGESLEMDGSESLDSDGEIVLSEWDFGDGASARGDVVTHRYAAPGAYRVTLRVRDNAGASNSGASETAVVTVNAPPLPAFKAPSRAAEGEALAFDASGSRDPDGRITGIEWDFGDGSVKPGVVVRHAYRKPGAYRVALRVRDDSGVSSAEAETTFTVRVNDPPAPDPGGDRTVNESEVPFDGGASTDSDDGIVEYRWDFGDGATAKGRETRHVYAVPGVYAVTLTVRDGSGTSSAERSRTARVRVNRPPVADAGRPRTAVPGETVALDASFSHDPDGRIVSWKWDLGAEGVRDGREASFTAGAPGVVQALLTVTDDAGAQDRHAVDITVNAPPAARIAPPGRAAPGRPVAFDGRGSTDPDGRLAGFEWNFGDGSPAAAGPTALHAFAVPGTYAVTLKIRDDSGAPNGTGLASATVTVNHPPVPDAGGDLHTCSQTVRLDGARSSDADGDPLSFSWNFGDSLSGSGASVLHTYHRPGVYPVRLTADDGTGLPNGRADAFLKVHVHSPPEAVLLAPADACAGEAVSFDAGRSSDADGDLLRAEWEFGDGGAGEGMSPVHVFRKGGRYRVRLTLTDNSGLPCNGSVAEAVIDVMDAPVSEAGPDREVCANQPVAFDGSASSGGNRPIVSYEWDFGDGGRASDARSSHAYQRPGRYTVRLKITVPLQGACENDSEDECTVRVLPSPEVAFEGPASGCPGETLRFDASATRTGDAAVRGLSWDFGDGASAEGPRAEHAYAAPGAYTVRLTVVTDAAEACNRAEAVRTVRINAPPRAVLSVDSAAGARPLTPLVFSARGSADQDGVIRQYEWDFGDGRGARGLGASHRYAAPGRYRVSLRVTDDSETACGVDSAASDIVLTGGTGPSVMGPEEAWAGEPLRFESDGPDRTLWRFGDGDTLTGRAAQKTFASAGLYEVQAFDGGLPGRALTVRVHDLPRPLLPDRLDVEEGAECVLDPVLPAADPSGAACSWDLGDGTLSEGRSVRHAYRIPGNYTARLTVRHGRRPAVPERRHEVRITVHPRFSAGIEVQPDTVRCGGARDEALFRARIDGAARPLAFHWDFGDGHSAMGPAASHAYAAPGAYTVKLTVTDAARPRSRPFVAERRIEVTGRRAAPAAAGKAAP